MTKEDEVFKQIQNKARSDASKEGRPTPTAEYLTRHALESFLDRLTRTEHKNDFVLKGGILLAVYGVRFELDTISMREIREGAEYPGFRIRAESYIGPQKAVITWDISTGDPIIPPPRRVRLPRILGAEIEILGYTPETIIAEKGVTILERGITSTRRRDYVDIIQLAEQHGIDEEQFLQSASAVARYRKVELGPLGPVVSGYGAVGRARWAAWRRKESIEAISEADLDERSRRSRFSVPTADSWCVDWAMFRGR